MSHLRGAGCSRQRGRFRLIVVERDSGFRKISGAFGSLGTYVADSRQCQVSLPRFRQRSCILPFCPTKWQHFGPFIMLRSYVCECLTSAYVYLNVAIYIHTLRKRPAKTKKGFGTLREKLRGSPYTRELYWLMSFSPILRSVGHVFRRLGSHHLPHDSSGYRDGDHLPCLLGTRKHNQNSISCDRIE